MFKKKKNARNEFLSLVPFATKKILDVGCGAGGLCAGFVEKNIEVVGLEKDEQLVAQARTKLSKVFSTDVENFKLPYPEGYFDCIIYADILEHLIDPLALLKEYRPYLNEKGCVVASIPNVRYYKVILRLILGGTWDYVDSGILDRTHLRFFTLKNMEELFMEAGYRVIKIQRNIQAASGFKFINFVCFGFLKDFLSYQYYIVAQKMEGDCSSIKERKRYKF